MKREIQRAVRDVINAIEARHRKLKGQKGSPTHTFTPSVDNNPGSVKPNLNPELRKPSNKKPPGDSLSLQTENVIEESQRKAYSPGERLQRSLRRKTTTRTTRFGGKQILDTVAIQRKRAQRMARYKRRKELAPNYQSLSAGQKQVIDDKLKNDPEVKHIAQTIFANLKDRKK